MDAPGLGGSERTEEGEDGTGVGDPGEGDGLVQDADGVDFVAEVFEGFEDGADVFGALEVACVDGGEHGLGEIGAEADAARGKSVDLKFGEMGDRGLLSDAADDEARIDDFDEAGEVIILGGIFADDGVFDPRNESVVDECRDGFWLEVAFELNVEDGRFSEGFDEFSEAGGNARVGDEAWHGEDHHGGEIEVFEDDGLIHHGAVGGADRWDDEGLLSTLGCDDVESFGVFAGGDVVEVGVATVEEGGHSSGFDVADDFGVFLALEFQVSVAGQGRDRDDGGVELFGCDW